MGLRSAVESLRQSTAGRVFGKVYEAFTTGRIGTFMNQGADELATGLKAFPDSIQHLYPGFGNSPHENLPTPSQVIDNPTAYQPEQQPGHQQANEIGREM